MIGETGGGVMRIAFITAGAAGMFCGSCMRDNTLVAALLDLGHDALLVPTYTPIRTDEADVSEGRGSSSAASTSTWNRSRGCSATPRGLLDWLLDSPRLLRWVIAVRRPAPTTSDLGELTVSMLRRASTATSGRRWKASPAGCAPR